MIDVPILKGNRVLLRKIQPKDIEDRFAIGRHNEFEHMCGGDTIEEIIFPPRQAWIDWYNSHKDEAGSLNTRESALAMQNCTMFQCRIAVQLMR